MWICMKKPVILCFSSSFLLPNQDRNRRRHCVGNRRSAFNFSHGQDSIKMLWVTSTMRRRVRETMTKEIFIMLRMSWHHSWLKLRKFPHYQPSSSIVSHICIWRWLQIDFPFVKWKQRDHRAHKSLVASVEEKKELRFFENRNRRNFRKWKWQVNAHLIDRVRRNWCN